MKSIIQLSNLKKVFSTDEVDTHALNEISLEVRSGEFLSITGPSGCGKSTLLSILGLLDTATSGSYMLSEHSVLNLNQKQRASIRNREIGFVFQSFNLISDLTVVENVELPLNHRREISRSERRSRAEAMLEKVDMLHRKSHYPAQLSGGQQQRVAVARAIVGDPSIILADEPTGNLDSKNAEQVMELLEKLHKSGATICMVTHDPTAAQRADRVIAMLDGRIVKDSCLANVSPVLAEVE